MQILLGMLITAGAFVFAGCATNQPVIPPGSVCVVSAPKAAFYKYGPAQSFGADLTLEHGTRVTMVERAFGFSRVMTENGITGYVASDEIDPVPAEPPKPPERLAANRKLPRTFSAPVKRSNVQSVAGDPLFDMNDVPLPTNDEPAKPEFRSGASARPAPEKKP